MISSPIGSQVPAPPFDKGDPDDHYLWTEVSSVEEKLFFDSAGQLTASSYAVRSSSEYAASYMIKPYAAGVLALLLLLVRQPLGAEPSRPLSRLCIVARASTSRVMLGILPCSLVR